MLTKSLLKVIFILVMISCDVVYSKNVKSGSKLKKTLDSDEEMDLLKSLTPMTEDEVNDVEEDEDELENTDSGSNSTSASSVSNSRKTTVSSDELADYPETPKTIRDVDILDGTGDTEEDEVVAAYSDAGDYKTVGKPEARSGTQDEKNTTANETTAPPGDSETDAETSETVTVQTELYSDNASVPEELNAVVESWEGEGSRRQGPTREFVFQPNLNDPAAVARFRTANDEITCRPLGARSTDSNSVSRFMASLAVFTPIILHLTI